jgi:tetratricopeptide (TPR) repeat protein
VLFQQAARAGDNFDQSNFEQQMQRVCLGYEGLLREDPKFAAGYAAYGFLLRQLGMDRESSAMLMKANQYDPNIPMVKNQLGNYLAEQGRPLDAVSYFMAAIKLAPNEPLYHYQLGTLLHEARDDFVLSDEWSAESVDAAMHEGFRRAAELVPDRIEFTYRYAESFYDLPEPDWDAALKVWARLEEQASTAPEREAMRLHAANVCLKLGKTAHAQLLLSNVTDPALIEQKQKLVAQLPDDSEE